MSHELLADICTIKIVTLFKAATLSSVPKPMQPSWWAWEPWLSQLKHFLPEYIFSIYWCKGTSLTEFFQLPVSQTWIRTANQLADKSIAPAVMQLIFSRNLLNKVSLRIERMLQRSIAGLKLRPFIELGLPSSPGINHNLPVCLSLYCKVLYQLPINDFLCSLKDYGFKLLIPHSRTWSHSEDLLNLWVHAHYSGFHDTYLSLSLSHFRSRF